MENINNILVDLLKSGGGGNNSQIDNTVGQVADQPVDYSWVVVVLVVVVVAGVYFMGGKELIMAVMGDRDAQPRIGYCSNNTHTDEDTPINDQNQNEIDFDCDEGYVLKDDANNIRGDTNESCCEILEPDLEEDLEPELDPDPAQPEKNDVRIGYCSENTHSDISTPLLDDEPKQVECNSGRILKEDANNIQGTDDETCCKDPKIGYCAGNTHIDKNTPITGDSDFQCNEDYFLKDDAENIKGNTNEICCYKPENDEDNDNDWDDGGSDGDGVESICKDNNSYKYNSSYCSDGGDISATLNPDWNACDRDKWLNTKYNTSENKPSWIPGYSELSENNHGVIAPVGISKNKTNKKIYYNIGNKKGWESHNNRPWRNSFKNSYINNDTGEWVHLCKCSNNFNPLTNCRCEHGKYFDTTKSGTNVCQMYPKTDGNKCISKENIGKNRFSRYKAGKIGDFYNITNPNCIFHSPSGTDGLYNSKNNQKFRKQCCPSCIHKFYESNFTINELNEKNNSPLINPDENPTMVKQAYAENGDNKISEIFLEDINSPLAQAGYKKNLKIPIGYNSRPPYYYPTWKRGDDEVILSNNKNRYSTYQDKDKHGYIKPLPEGGKEKCTDGNDNVADCASPDDYQQIRNNMFYCRRTDWVEGTWGKTPPRGTGKYIEELPTYEESPVSGSYNDWNFDFKNNIWIKKNEIYNKYGYYGPKYCTGGSSWKRDGGREARHVEKECNKSGYWKNAVNRKCIGKYHHRSKIGRDQHHGTCR